METLQQLADTLSDECFAEYRAVATGYRGPWRATKSCAENDGQQHAGAYGYKIVRRIAP